MDFEQLEADAAALYDGAVLDTWRISAGHLRRVGPETWPADVFGDDLTADEWAQVRSAGIPTERIASACYRHAFRIAANVLLSLRDGYADERDIDLTQEDHETSDAAPTADPGDCTTMSAGFVPPSDLPIREPGRDFE